MFFSRGKGEILQKQFSKIANDDDFHTYPLS